MQISGTVHSIKIPFSIPIAPGRSLPRFVYVHMIFGEKIWLIDTGVAGSETVIFDYIRKAGRSPEDISMIVQTHSHPDHIGATKAIKEATKCAVAIHKAEREWLEDVVLQNRQRPIPGFTTLVGGSVRVDRILNEGDILEPDETHRIGVFHTPGHSTGSVSLLLQPERILITGDAVPLPGDLPIYENFGESVRSVEKLKMIRNVSSLLSAWDEPRHGAEASEVLDRSLKFLATIDSAVAGSIGTDNLMDPMELCRKVVEKLGLPPAAVTPHLAKTFQANVRELAKKA